MIKKRTKRKIISYIVTFVLMLCIMCSSMIVVGKYSMFSKHGVFRAYERVGFFDGLSSELQIEAYQLGIPYGIEKKCLKDVFQRKYIMRDLMDTLSAELEGETTVIKTDFLRSDIKSNVTRQMGKLTQKQEESLNKYIVEVEKMYQKKMVVPGLEYIAKMINIATKLLLIVVPICVLLAILCMFYLISTRSQVYRGMRYITYAVLGAGITLLTVFAAFISDGFIYRFNISDVFMRRFYTYYIGHEFLMQVFTGIGFLILGCIMIYMIKRKKYNQ